MVFMTKQQLITKLKQSCASVTPELAGEHVLIIAFRGEFHVLRNSALPTCAHLHRLPRNIKAMLTCSYELQACVLLPKSGKKMSHSFIPISTPAHRTGEQIAQPTGAQRTVPKRIVICLVLDAGM